MSKKPKLGDVFTVPVDEVRTGFGQIVEVASPNVPFYAVFDRCVPLSAVPTYSQADLEAVAASPILLLSRSTDARIQHGMWAVIGSARVQADIPFPVHKVLDGAKGRIVSDYAHQLSRRATAAEWERLGYDQTNAPIALEKAIAARFGVGEWLPRYQELLVHPELSTGEFFPGSGK